MVLSRLDSAGEQLGCPYQRLTRFHLGEYFVSMYIHGDSYFVYRDVAVSEPLPPNAPANEDVTTAAVGCGDAPQIEIGIDVANESADGKRTSKEGA